MTKTRNINICGAFAAIALTAAMQGSAPLNADASNASIEASSGAVLVRNRTLVPKAVRLIIGFRQSVTV